VPLISYAGTAQLLGCLVFGWSWGATELLWTVITGLLSAIWQLLQPGADPSTQHMSEMHQAIIKVTRDASRVADLLEVGMSV